MQESDLGGTGLLVKAYAPRIVVPNIDSVSLRYLNDLHPLTSGFFHVYDFDASRTVLLPRSSPLVFPNEKPVDEMLSRFSIDYAGIHKLVGTFADSVRQVQTPSVINGEQLRDLLIANQDAIVRSTKQEFNKVYAEINHLKKEVLESQRVLAELTEPNLIDLNRMVMGAPQRIIEKIWDEKILATVGVAAAKLFAHYFIAK